MIQKLTTKIKSMLDHMLWSVFWVKNVEKHTEIKLKNISERTEEQSWKQEQLMVIFIINLKMLNGLLMMNLISLSSIVQLKQCTMEW